MLQCQQVLPKATQTKPHLCNKIYQTKHTQPNQTKHTQRPCAKTCEKKLNPWVRCVFGNARISLQEKHQGNHPPEQLVFLARQLLEARQGTLRELKNRAGVGSKMGG